jgi:hypothetical protein
MARNRTAVPEDRAGVGKFKVFMAIFFLEREGKESGVHEFKA